VNDLGLEPGVVNDCAAQYRDELLEVEAEMRMTFAVVPTDRRKLVTNHDSLGYLADRFEFEVVGTVLPSPSGLAETNPAQLEALSQLIEAEGVPTVFVDASKSTDDAEALAGRVGDITIVTLFTESTGVPGAETYVDFLLSNAKIIADALAR
jgi:zinc/manganese transport system substrate-binding protein